MVLFAYPIFLYLLLLIPLFYLLYALFRAKRKARVAKFGNPDLVEKLMPERSKYRGWIKLILFSLAWFFLVIGLARPQLGAVLKESSNEGAEIMIALDVSNSMLAKDYSPNRLERAKMDISRMVDKLHSDRIGLVIFAGEAFVQLPITADYVSSKIFLNSIDNTSIPIQGTSLAEAIVTCTSSFSQEAKGGKNNRAIILISDGEDHEGEAVEAAKYAVEQGIKVYTVGVGSPQGAPIQLSNGELMKDNNGEIVVTKLNEQILQEIAIAGEGVYVRASDGHFGLSDILNKIRELEKTSYKSVAFEEYNEQFMYFLAISLFFLLLEFLIGNRKMKKTIFLLLSILSLASVNSFAQVDRKEVKKGNKFFNKESYKQAEVEYRKALIKDSVSLLSNYNLANTLFRINDLSGAISASNKLTDTISRIPYEYKWGGTTTTLPNRDSNDNFDFTKYQGEQSVASNYFFNQGNFYLQQNQYDKAVEAYKQSLIRNPADMTAKANYEYAKKKLQNQQNQQNQDKQQQDQDKNKDQEQNKKQEQNQDKQQNQDNQQKDQDQNKDKQQDQNQNKEQEQNQEQNQNKLSQQATQQMLQALQDKENQTQEKVKKAKAAAARSKKKEKNW